MALLWCAIAMLVAGTGFLAQQRPLPVYRIVDLGTLGGDSSEAASINLLGDVVGTSTLANGRPHAFLYRAGRMVDVGTLKGGTESHAAAIADNGVIVGYSGINDEPGFIPEFKYQGFVWQDGTMRTVGSLYCYCSPSRRYGTSRTLAINNAGIAVGSTLAGGFATPTHAFRFQNGRLEDIGDPPAAGLNSVAWGINDLGEITGTTDRQAFLWRDGVRRELGVPPGFARSEGRAINGKGQVAGNSVTAAGMSRGFLWDLGTMHGLDPWPGDVSSEARALNKIVGTGRHNGQTRAFLLQP